MTSNSAFKSRTSITQIYPPPPPQKKKKKKKEKKEEEEVNEKSRSGKQEAL